MSLHLSLYRSCTELSQQVDIWAVQTLFELRFSGP